jgi:hypothetical protein
MRLFIKRKKKVNKQKKGTEKREGFSMPAILVRTILVLSVIQI